MADHFDFDEALKKAGEIYTKADEGIATEAEAKEAVELYNELITHLSLELSDLEHMIEYEKLNK
jgi:hypothetical protein